MANGQSGVHTNHALVLVEAVSKHVQGLAQTLHRPMEAQTAQAMEQIVRHVAQRYAVSKLC